MVPYDQTETRIKALRRKEAKGELSHEAAEAKIEALRKKGAVYVARWTLATGKEATKAGFKTEKAARAYEAIQADKVAKGDAAAPAHVKAKVSEIIAFYLDYLKGKGSYGSARKHCEVCVRLIGDMRLDKISAHADEILNTYIFETAAEEYPDRKTLWNHYVYIKAAFNRWIKKKRIQMVTPWVVVDFPNPGSRRTVTPDFEAYSKILAEASKPGRPIWAPLVFIIAWHHGRRGGEIFKMRWEDVHLNPGAEDMPWVRFVALKQSGQAFDEVPLFAEAYAALKAYHKGQAEGKVFPLSRLSHDKNLRRIMDAAGFPGLWLHDFRRAFNNRMRHLDQKTRSAFDGHRSEGMDDYYWTERRKSLEHVVQDSYSLSGVIREYEIENGVFDA